MNSATRNEILYEENARVRDYNEAIDDAEENAVLAAANRWARAQAIRHDAQEAA